MTTRKNHSLDRWTFVGKVMSLFFNTLSKLVITFLPRSKHLLISWLQSPSAVILEPPKIKSDTVSTVPHLFAMKWWGQMPWSSFSEYWALSQLFHSPLTFIKRLFSSSSLSAIRVVSSAYLRLLRFLSTLLNYNTNPKLDFGIKVVLFLLFRSLIISCCTMNTINK